MVKPELPKPTNRALFKAVFWDRWVGVVTLLWAIYGVLDWLDGKVIPALWPEYKSTWDRFYFLPGLTWHTWVVGTLIIVAVVALHGAFKFAQGYRKRYEELTKDKLVFEIDVPNTSVRLEQQGSKQAGLVIRIWLDVRLRFENLVEHPTTVKRFDLELYRGAERIFTWLSIARYSCDGIPIRKEEIEGMTVQGSRVTPWYSILMALTVAEKLIAQASDIDVNDYLKLTMHVGGYQMPFQARLHPHWTAALEEGGTSQIVVTGAKSMEKDFRRFD